MAETITEVSIPKHEAVVICEILSRVALGETVESFGDEARTIADSLQSQLVLEREEE